jgi:hypothetical protein
MPDDSLPPADKAVIAFFEIIAFALGWNGVDRLLAGGARLGSLLLVASIFVCYAGFKWPRIKLKILRSKKESERDALEVGQSRNWTDQEMKFRKFEVSSVLAELWEDAHSGEQQWEVTDNDEESDISKEIHSLCRLAGGKLIRSPSMHLSANVLSQKDNGRRWLYFLSETQDLSETNVMKSRHLGSKTYVSKGKIKNLASASARACIDCAGQTLNA